MLPLTSVSLLTECTDYAWPRQETQNLRWTNLSESMMTDECMHENLSSPHQARLSQMSRQAFKADGVGRSEAVQAL